MIYDVIIIGGGSAGYAAARTAVAEIKKRGLDPCGKVALIEGAQQMGGLCILRGCMPTKALLESSHRHYAITQAETFGLIHATARPDPLLIWQRKDRLIKEFADHRVEQLTDGRFDLIRGEASFLNACQINVREETQNRLLEAKAYIIATGSEIAWPPLDGLRSIDPLTSDTALARPHIPKNLIVLGAGAVSLEFAQFYAHLGTRVTLLQRSNQIARDFDPDVAAELELELIEQGIDVKKGVRLISFEKNGASKSVRYEWEGNTHILSAEEIFHGLGRRPSIEKLHLEAAGVCIEFGRLAVNAKQQSSVENIFAAGDVTGQEEVVHVAVKAGEIAAHNACAHIYNDRPYETMPWGTMSMAVIFTSPEVARVGLTESQALAAGKRILTARYPFSDHGKSMIHGSRHGFVKLIAEARTGEILGASVVGPCGSDLIHEIVPCLYFRAKAQDLAAMPHYHPTLAEIWTYPAEEIADLVARQAS
jgi:pyruvate/2-oxoglutarate dehydrogenase complex dihydrolipoamide dehydrogenase (E3) component